MASTVVATRSPYHTMSDVQERLGYVPVERIVTRVPPGCATEQDLLDSSITGDRGFELVDGILVEKAVGYRAEYIGTWICYLILVYLEKNNLGGVTGGRGGVRFKVGLVRLPDVTCTRWDSVDDPDDIEYPDGPFLESTPDLVVEVFSPGNTRREMEIKLAEYAKAGVKLVWYVDPERKEVDVYLKGNPRRKKTLGVSGVLDGGDVLPGFTLPVSQLFEKRAPAKKPGKKPNCKFGDGGASTSGFLEIKARNPKSARAVRARIGTDHERGRWRAMPRMRRTRIEVETSFHNQNDGPQDHFVCGWATMSKRRQNFETIAWFWDLRQ